MSIRAVFTQNNIVNSFARNGLNDSSLRATHNRANRNEFDSRVRSLVQAFKDAVKRERQDIFGVFEGLKENSVSLYPTGDYRPSALVVLASGIGKTVAILNDDHLSWRIERRAGSGAVEVLEEALSHDNQGCPEWALDLDEVRDAYEKRVVAVALAELEILYEEAE